MDIADYLASIKYAKARDHKEEVDKFMDTLDMCSSDDVFTVPCWGLEIDLREGRYFLHLWAWIF